MRLRHRLALLAAVALLSVSAVPSAEAANPALLRAIVVQIGNGTFDPCHFTPEQLQTALGSIPPDFDEYNPNIRLALETALNSRDCTKPKPHGKGPGSSNPAAGGGAPGGGGTSAGGTAGPPAGTPAHPGRSGPHEKIKPSHAPSATPGPTATKSVAAVPASAGEGSGTPGVLLVLAVLGGLGALGALLVAASRGLGWEPRWAPAMRHAWAEAGHRSGATWGDFRDWMRLGR